MIKSDPTDQLTQLVDAVLQSSKYRTVHKDLIKRIGSRELANRHNLKEATKATKNKLHQVGAFLDPKPAFDKWLLRVEEAAQRGDNNSLRQVCADIMAHHASTRERLPILNLFYEKTLSDLPPIRSLLDVACGLNPLSLLWMPHADTLDYYAYDIYENLIDFLNEFFALMQVRGYAEVCDVIQLCSPPKVDLALILKSIPCLEQIDKSAARRLLDTINADHVLVSFPVHSLSGRNKGMAIHYEAKFRELTAGRSWVIARFDFETELVFRISK